jgi:hypothetical protein
MINKPAFRINRCGPLSRAIVAQGYSDFTTLARAVCELPYGRPNQLEEVLSVLIEQKGTCSSKHRLLAALAHECGHQEIELMVGIYQMGEENTPGVGAVLTAAGLEWIPEAHCYLRKGENRYDYTGLQAGAHSPFVALLAEFVVLPAKLYEKKLALHREALSNWAAGRRLDLARAWKLREACIEALSN